MNTEEQRKITKDEKIHHGPVDEIHRNNSSVNQTQLPLLSEKSGAILLEKSADTYFLLWYSKLKTN